VLSLTARRSAAGGGVVFVLRFALGAVLNYGFGLALAWMLTPAQFGAVSVLQNVQFFCSALLAAGFPWALTAVVARGGDRGVVAATYRAAFGGNLVVGAVVVSVFLVAQSTHAVVPDASAIVVLCVALMIATMSVNTSLGGALQGERRLDGYGVMQVTEIVVKVAVALVLIGLLHRGVDGVAASFLVGALVSAVIGWWALRDRLPGRGPVAWRATGRRALSMGTASSAFGVILTIDVIALSVLGQGHGVGAADVAVYQAALVLARAPFFLGDALSNAVFPFIAGAKTAEDVNGWFLSAFRWVPLVLMPLQLLLLLAPALPLRVFFPAAYAAAAPLLQIMTIGTLGLLTMEMLLKALNARELSAALAWRVPVVLAAEIAALLVAVPRWGATGAAVAFAVGSWMGAVLLGHLYVQHFHPDAPRISTVARYLLALTPLVAALLATGWLPELPAVAVVVAGLAGYAVAVLRLGLIREQDVARVRRLVDRVRPRRRGAVQS
jgi:O-antigen/teichoic acid export membrane protein